MNTFSSLTKNRRTKFAAFFFKVHKTLWVYILYANSNFILFVPTLRVFFIS